MRSTLVGLALLSLALPAHASTWIVDINNGPGTSFTQISAAIAAAAAGDTLLVQPGSYANFTLDKPLAIIGLSTQSPSTVIVGQATLLNLPAVSTTSIAHLHLQQTLSLSVLDCAGAVMLDDVLCQGGVFVQSCADLRLRRFEADFGLTATSSRLEIADSLLLGRDGTPCQCCPDAWILPAGPAGLQATGGEVHLTRTTAIGGRGSDAYCGDTGCGSTAGDGGPGVRLLGSARLLLSGSSEFFLQGGAGGGTNCVSGFPGLAGPPLLVSAGCEARISGETIVGAIQNQGTLVQATPADPFLRALGSATAGAPFTLRLSGPPGATAQVLLGRRPIVVPTPALDEEQLVPINRVFNLGTIPASGTVSLNFPVASFWPSGFSVVFQGRVTLPDTTQLLTNSVPAIVP